MATSQAVGQGAADQGRMEAVTATIAKVCAACGRVTPSPVRGRCPACAAPLADREAARRRAKPQRRVWDSTQWRQARKAALRRDGHRCRYTPDERYAPSNPTRCNEPASTVHHAKAVTDGGRFDPADLVSMCRSHHGMVDGRRAAR